MTASWQEHAGRKILKMDYRGLKTEQMLDVLTVGARMVEAEPPGVLILTDLSSSPIAPEFMKAVKKINAELLAPRRCRQAVVGFGGIGTMLLRAYNKMSPDNAMMSFATENDALNYLVS